MPWFAPSINRQCCRLDRSRASSETPGELLLKPSIVFYWSWRLTQSRVWSATSMQGVTQIWMPIRCAAAPLLSDPICVPWLKPAHRTAAWAACELIGIEAEAAMLEATAGVNTHRGAIFGLGLLCAAAGARWSGTVESTAPLGSVVARRWGKEILSGPVTLRSHGLEARRRYGRPAGARCQAADGFPSVYGIGLPALEQAVIMAPADAEAVRVHACFSLIAAVEDTNLLHRGGTAGLSFAQSAARSFLDRGGVSQRDWRVRARTVHEAFVQGRLSPGGSADLLAMSLFVQALESDRRRVSSRE